jgi:preprotein translocase subunit SecG
MSYLIGLLTAILVLDCLFLMLLILVQLPKKETGMGSAFGGGATDALFGAGAGNTLTMLTKWASIVFLGLALLLSVLNAGSSKKKSGVREALSKQAVTAPATPAPVVPISNALTAPAVTNVVPAFGAETPVPASTGVVETITTVTNAAVTNAATVTNTATSLLQKVVNTVTNEAAKAAGTIQKEVEAATKK